MAFQLKNNSPIKQVTPPGKGNSTVIESTSVNRPKVIPIRTDRQKESERLSLMKEKAGDIKKLDSKASIDERRNVDQLLNPLTAFGYAARNEEMPKNFGKGPRNPLDNALDIVNPFFYAKKGISAIGNTVSGISNIAKGKYPSAKRDFKNAAIDAFEVLPVAAEIRSSMKTAKLVSAVEKIPVNLVGGESVVKGVVEAGINKLSKKALPPIVEQGVKEVTRQVEGLIPKQRKLSVTAQAAKDQVDRTSFSNFGDASTLPRKDYVKIYTENKVKAPGFKGKQLEQRLKHGKENVAKALNANLDWVESNRYTRNRSANTGETEKEVVASVNDYKRKFMNTKLNFLDDPTGETAGTYSTVTKNFNNGSTRDVHSIEAQVRASRFRGKYNNTPENTLDHEIGHAFSPTSKHEETYKNYPLIKTNRGILEQKQGKTYDTTNDMPYLDRPQEQQVRMKRLSQSIRRDFDLGQEKRITTKHVERYKDFQSWKGNNPSYMWYESPDVADLIMSSPKKYSSTASLTRHLNKAWTAPVVTAGAAGTMMNKSKKK